MTKEARIAALEANAPTGFEHLTDAELLAKARSLTPSTIEKWRTGTLEPGDEKFLLQALHLFPDLADKLSDQERHDLGL